MKYLSCLFLCIVCSTLQAQHGYEEEKPFDEVYAYGCKPEEENCGVVIAMSGLKLRDAPSFKAKTLGVMPFGEKVRLTEHARDLQPLNYRAWIKDGDSIAGYWMQVTWKGKTGYAFSTYIGDRIFRMNEPTYLLFEDQGLCWNDCYASPAYHYYGIYTNEDSSKWEIKREQPSFEHSDLDFSGTCITVKDQRPTCFIVASQKPLPEGALRAQRGEAIVFQRNYYPGTTQETANRVKIPASTMALWVKSDNQGHVNLFLTEEKSRKNQLIGANIFTDKIELLWTGDLDGDGIMDFMLGYSSDHSFGCQLFLSGSAAPKQLVKPVIIYWFGDCC